MDANHTPPSTGAARPPLFVDDGSVRVHRERLGVLAVLSWKEAQLCDERDLSAHGNTLRRYGVDNTCPACPLSPSSDSPRHIQGAGMQHMAGGGKRASSLARPRRGAHGELLQHHSQGRLRPGSLESVRPQCDAWCPARDNDVPRHVRVVWAWLGKALEAVEQTVVALA